MGFPLKRWLACFTHYLRTQNGMCERLHRATKSILLQKSYIILDRRLLPLEWNGSGFFITKEFQ